MRTYLLFFILTCLFSILTFIIPSRNIPKQWWGVSHFNLFSHDFAVITHSDSPEFVRLAITFPFGYSENNIRINRPLYPFICSLIFHIIIPITQIPESMQVPILEQMKEIKLVNAWKGITANQIAISWISCIITNIILMTISVNYYYKGLKNMELKKWSFIIVSILFLTHLFKNYILIPQTYLFDFIIPSIVFYIWTLFQNKQITSKKYYFNILFIGILLLGKGLFYCIPIFIWLGFKIERIQGAVKSLVCILSPTVIYLILLLLFRIPYYNHEVSAYQEGIWILLSFHSIGLNMTVIEILKKGYALLTITANVLWIELLALILNYSGINIMKIVSKMEYYFIVIYFMSLTFFWITIGIFFNRNIYTIYPLFFLIFGKMFVSRIQKRTVISLIFVYISLFVSNYILFSYSL
jgi:hypothetical protein